MVKEFLYVLGLVCIFTFIVLKWAKAIQSQHEWEKAAGRRFTLKDIDPNVKFPFPPEDEEIIKKKDNDNEW